MKRERTGKPGQSGDAVSSIGMRRQRGRRFDPMALLRLDCTIEGNHLSGIDAHGLKQAKPLAVRLILVEPAIAQHPQHTRTFDAVRQRSCEISSHGRDQETGRALFKQSPDRMPLVNMLDLMGEDAGELFGSVGGL